MFTVRPCIRWCNLLPNHACIKLPCIFNYDHMTGSHTCAAEGMHTRQMQSSSSIIVTHVYTYLCMHATIVTYPYIQLHNSSLQFEGRWQWISLYHTLVCKGTTSVSKILTYIGVDQRTLQCCKRSTIRKLLNLDWTANGKNKWRCNVQGCEVIAAYVNKMTRLEYVSVWSWTLHSTVCRWCVYMVCVGGACM